MKKYELIEINENTIIRIRYEIKEIGDTIVATLLMPKTTGSARTAIGILEKETKRGWTIRSYMLTTKPIDIFLPRKEFLKIQIK